MSVLLPPNLEEVARIVMIALAEDVGHGDITSRLTVEPATHSRLALVAREPMVVSGVQVAQSAFEAMDEAVECEPRVADGDRVAAGTVLAEVTGPSQSLLAAERVALNLMQRMCGVATETARYVEAIGDSPCKLLDTRKTMPGLREIDKYAVRCGGGHNHRMRLDDAILIKDNHIALAGGVVEALRRATTHAPATLRIQIECDTVAQVEEALAHGAQMLLLDNMSLDDLRRCVALAKAKEVPTEASGNVSLETIRAIAQTGVDYISVGRITHSARAMDIGLDVA